MVPTIDINWSWRIPLPERLPFREARLRIDGTIAKRNGNEQLLKLVAEAFEAQRLVRAPLDLSLNQLATRESRCRTQLAKFLRIAWLSPRIVEDIAAGKQLRSLTRRSLLTIDLPGDWAEQERVLGFVA